MPKKSKKQKEMEKQLQAFAGTTAGSTVIALGIGVAALPYAVQYLVRSAENLALPYASMLGVNIGDKVAQHAKDLRAKLEGEDPETWHEANPDVTTADIDIPAVTGDPYTAYLQKVGLPPSTVLIAFGDKQAISTYELSGEWNYYGTRQINKQHYYVVVPKGIRVYIRIPRTLTEAPDEHDLCRAGWKGRSVNGVVVCEKETVETFLLDPSSWPGGIFLGQG